MKESILAITLSLALIAVSLAAFVGWGMNIYKLCTCDFEPSYKAEAIRTIGIVVAPVGCVAGWMDLGK